MAAVLLGSDAASASFLARKAAVAESLGIGFELVSFSGLEPQADIERSLRSLAADPSVGGIVLQLPVPPVYDRDALIAAIGIAKDVDNLTGNASVPAPAAGTVQAVLASCGKSIADYKAVRIVGNGFLVGAPVARLCAEAGVPYEVADIATPDLTGFIHGGDLVINGVGKAGLVDADWLADGVGAIDFGFPADFDQDALGRNAARLAFYTPTPFGTGPILVAKLFENFYSLNS